MNDEPKTIVIENCGTPADCTPGLREKAAKDIANARGAFKAVCNWVVNIHRCGDEVNDLN